MFFFFLMIRRPPRSTQSRSSAASDVYKRQGLESAVQGTIGPPTVDVLEHLVGGGKESVEALATRFVQQRLRRATVNSTKTLEAFDFIFQQPGQELDVGPVAVHGLAVTGFQGLQNAGEPQLGQVRGELVSQFHAPPPNR